MDKITPISDVVWFQEGPGVRNTQYTTEGVKLLNVANLVDGEVDLSNTNRYISEEEAYGKYKHFLVDEGDLIIASSGIKVDYFDKKMGFIKKEHLPLCMNTSTIRFKTLNADVLDIRYFMYFLKSESFKQQLAVQITGSAQLNFGPSHLKKMSVKMVPMAQQKEIVHNLSEIDRLISYRQQQIIKLDELVKSRFIELFGDPITNSNNLPTERMEQRFGLKAGITTAADDIHDFQEGAYEIPCYGGNGIRGYVKEKSYTGDYPIIGRQGALCGNVQYATGEFHATEHAVLVSLLKNDNSVWVYHLLKLMDLFRYHTGAAQPGLAVKTLNTVEVIVADKRKQDQFAAFVEQTDKSKLAIQQSLDKLELLKKSLMQEYFG